MKLSQVLELRSLFIQLKSIKLPIRASYQIAKFLQKTETDLKFYQEEYQAIIETYASRDENGNKLTAENGGIKVDPTKADECVAKMNELNNTEIENYELKLYNSDFSNIELSIDQVSNLIPFFVD